MEPKESKESKEPKEKDTITINSVDIPRHVYNSIRYQVNESHKNDLINKFGSVLENPDDLIKMKMGTAMDKVRDEIINKIENMQTKSKEPDKDEIEKLLSNNSAQIKSEYDIKIKDIQKDFSQEILKRDMIQSATGKNLLPEYQGEFIYNVQSNFKFDPQDEVYKFRTKDGNPFINSDGKPGNIEDIVNFISEKKPIFFQNTKTGAGTHSGNGAGKENTENMSNSELIKYGMRKKGLI